MLRYVSDVHYDAAQRSLEKAIDSYARKARHAQALSAYYADQAQSLCEGLFDLQRAAIEWQEAREDNSQIASLASTHGL